MQRRMFAGLFLVSLFIVSDGGAQQFQANDDRPVWTMEFIKVKSGMFGSTLGYLDDNWMREREEAKRQGAVVAYYRIAEGSRESDGSIVLMTEFKNPTAYAAREALFASMRKQRHQFNTQGVIRFGRPEDLYEAMNTRVFQDYSDMDNVRFRELSKKQHVWDKTVIDGTDDLKNWVEVFRPLVSNTKVLKIVAFSNNHYAGHGPATAKLFMDLWNKKQ